jgi:glycerol-3-phosphate cytidylyltransferase
MIVGFTCSAFDLLHPGHVAMLRECASRCEYLIVGLHTDPSIDRAGKNKPIQTVYERYLQLESCKYVDKIIPYETESDLINLLCIEKIDIRFAGEEYNDTYLTGQDICESRGIKILYNSRKHKYSSTELRSRMR